MMAQRADVESFRAALEASTGMTFPADRDASLGDALRQRLRATGRGVVAEYLPMLAPKSDEAAEIARLLTVSETYFFRNIEQFNAARSFVERRMASGRRELSILSAGCSSGEEAYSLAMLLLDTIGGEIEDWRISIRAIDLNPEVVKKARRASYSAWSLRETPPAIRDRHFRRDAGAFSPTEKVRRMVDIERHNLLDPDPTVWQHEGYDIVFCRNVLMYLAPDAARRIVSSIAGSLVEDGLLFLGHAETLRGLSTDFHLCQSHGAFYYRRASGVAVEHAAPPRALIDVPSLRRGDTSWFKTIAQSSARVTELAVPQNAASTPTGMPVDDLSRTLELIAHERYAEALACLTALPHNVRERSDALLLQAMLLTCGGQPSVAEGVCERLLARSEPSAGAHYVMALCREHAGDTDRAVERDRMAIRLDASFSMAHLHLGRLLRRRGDRANAAGALAAAAELLAREDTARLAVFGGGFTREGLIALCRAERRACEVLR